MLSNCEKMVVISSTTNEWPQTHNIDEKDLMASTARLMEKPAVTQEQQQQPQQQAQQQIQQQQALKCPRCDSSNTKFCYYNNYSLSQPRHFCKACKRYWTRGGTLRNVPVGGGCRKNKRVKRPASAIDAAGGVSSTSGGANPNLSHSHQPQIDVSSTSSPHHINPLFYGLTNNPSDINNNLPFPARFNSTGGGGGGGYDLQPQLNALALGFSSGGTDSHHDYGNGFNVNPSKQIQDVSNPLLSSYSNLFGSSSSSSNTPTIASLLASTLHQHKFMNGGVKNTTQNTPNHFQALPPFQDLQVTGNNTTENGLSMKDHVKVELEGQSRSMEWNVNVGCQNQLEQIGLSDPAVYWNPTSVGGGGAWHDPSNIGSSVTSLM